MSSQLLKRFFTRLVKGWDAKSFQNPCQARLHHPVPGKWNSYLRFGTSAIPMLETAIHETNLTAGECMITQQVRDVNQEPGGKQEIWEWQRVVAQVHALCSRVPGNLTLGYFGYWLIRTLFLVVWALRLKKFAFLLFAFYPTGCTRQNWWGQVRLKSHCASSLAGTQRFLSLTGNIC